MSSHQVSHLEMIGLVPVDVQSGLPPKFVLAGCHEEAIAAVHLEFRKAKPAFASASVSWYVFEKPHGVAPRRKESV